MKNIRQHSVSDSLSGRSCMALRSILSFFLLLSSLTLAAQSGFLVKGKVLDANDEPLIGAAIVLKGNTSVGTVADFDGNFMLEVPSKSSVLIVSY